VYIRIVITNSGLYLLPLNLCIIYTNTSQKYFRWIDINHVVHTNSDLYDTSIFCPGDNAETIPRSQIEESFCEQWRKKNRFPHGTAASSDNEAKEKWSPDTCMRDRRRLRERASERGAESHHLTTQKDTHQILAIIRVTMEGCSASGCQTQNERSHEEAADGFPRSSHHVSSHYASFAVNNVDIRRVTARVADVGMSNARCLRGRRLLLIDW